MLHDLTSDRQALVAGAIVAVLLVLAVAFVATSLDRPRPPEFPPSPRAPHEVGARLDTGRYTVDASHERRWRYFDFSVGSVVEDPGPVEWDLAFRRNRILVNGGAGFPGIGGAIDLGEVPFESVDSLPATGYVGSEAGSDSVHPVLGKWYDYGFTSHVLTPKPRVYAVRTADGRYAKLRIVSYYCPGARAGCTTFQYAYQGDGSRYTNRP